MTMDWTIDQIFSDLESCTTGDRMERINPAPTETNSGIKFVESGTNYMDELDRLLGPDVWRDNFGATDFAAHVNQEVVHHDEDQEDQPEEDNDPTPSILAYLPSPPPADNTEDEQPPIEDEDLPTEESSETPILLPPPMEYRDKDEEDDFAGPASVVTSSSFRSASPTSPFTW